MGNLFENLPPSVKSLWNSEVELRRAVQNAVFMRGDVAKVHLAEARRHFSEALASFNSADKLGGEEKWGSHTHTEKTLQNHEDAAQQQPDEFKPDRPVPPQG
jgi:hypothetical protein